MKIRKIVQVLKANRRFVISSHQNLEGDAIGSQLALYQLLRALKKEVRILSPEAAPETYMFLPDIKKVHYSTHGKKLDYDVACVVDCTDMGRLGEIKDMIDLRKPIINIDHHVSNSHFGTINWVDPNVSCTGEQIYQLFKGAGVHIDRNSALYIYVAILTDTGSFRYSNTTAKTHEIVSELLSKGLSPTPIYRRIYEDTHRSKIALLCSALSTLNVTPDGKIAWIRVTRKMLNKHKVEMQGTEEFVNFPRSIKGVKIALAFREIKRNIIKVSFRSNDNTDVNKLARIFGGGGHVSASGCTLHGHCLAEVEQAVVLKAKEHVFKSNG